jgi:hypothetical protein
VAALVAVAASVEEAAVAVAAEGAAARMPVAYQDMPDMQTSCKQLRISRKQSR